MGEAKVVKKEVVKKKSFFKGLKGEFKKIIWPDRTTLAKQTVTVLFVSLLVGAIITVIDLLFQAGVGYIY
ncbi:preprotein translocase subunit SecE [Vallitalea sp.]|uniref:preprotein translocase subunit SecE n=1 Tax=Vallitalea sp. TaxID=1882829 RepID=UPI0025FA2BC2|nr:preprotein translocase subunit SecE [Vallitalea sp.]MCT4686257.1 preprotein translocase subunit SecE [Vallitalea sp.]